MQAKGKVSRKTLHVLQTTAWNLFACIIHDLTKRAAAAGTHHHANYQASLLLLLHSNRNHSKCNYCHIHSSRRHGLFFMLFVSSLRVSQNRSVPSLSSFFAFKDVHVSLLNMSWILGNYSDSLFALGRETDSDERVWCRSKMLRQEEEDEWMRSRWHGWLTRTFDQSCLAFTSILLSR